MHRCAIRPLGLPRKPRCLSHPSLLLALFVFGACGADETAIDVYLIPDPNITVREQLFSMTETLQLILDSQDGLYGVDRAQDYGSLRIMNADADEPLEAVFTTALDAALPVIRIDRGELTEPASGIDIRVRAPQPGGEKAVAFGEVQGVRFEDGQTKRLDIPFNIQPEFRPPRVNDTVPRNGESVGVVEQVFIVFSKPMDVQSLLAKGAITLESITGGKRELVPIKEIVVQRLGANTTVRLEFEAGRLEPKTYGLRVSSGVVDDSNERRALDQVPSISGNQAFYAQFIVTSAAAANKTQNFGESCEQGGTACPAPMTCDQNLRQCRFACPVSCPKTTVCDDFLGVCVDDCRVAGCFSHSPECDHQTGLCKASDG
jgi:hypothetical protein